MCRHVGAALVWIKDHIVMRWQLNAKNTLIICVNDHKLSWDWTHSLVTASVFGRTRIDRNRSPRTKPTSRKTSCLFSRDPLQRSPETLQQTKGKPRLPVDVEEERERERGWKTHMSCTFEKVTLWIHLHMCMALHLLGSACLLATHVQPRSTRTTTEPVHLNVLTLRYIFDRGGHESCGIDYVAHDAKRGDLRDFIWGSLLGSIYLILVAYHASRRGFFPPHGWVLFRVHALIPGLHPSHRHARRW